jgi:DNA-binding XRE family transcriptional regulator
MTPTQKIKAAVRARDGNRCVECGITESDYFAIRGRSLDVHRINPTSEYSTEPGVCATLCFACHGKYKRSTPNHQDHDGLVQSIRQTVYRLRTAAGLTQATLAERSGVLACHISRLESGTTTPSLSTLLKLANALELPIAMLLEKQPPAPPPAPKERKRK